MAAVTKNLGFGVTVNLSYESPYQFARRFASLDHLTHGRIGWNIVTGYLDSAQRLIGENGLKDHDLRYEQAEEFLQLCYKFWESSWEDDAVLKISSSVSLLIQPRCIRSITKASFIAVRAYSRFPSVQRTPVLFQAGASPRGMALLPSMLKACLLVVNIQTRSRNRSIRFVVKRLNKAVILKQSKFCRYYRRDR